MPRCRASMAGQASEGTSTSTVRAPCLLDHALRERLRTGEIALAHRAELAGSDPHRFLDQHDRLAQCGDATQRSTTTMPTAKRWASRRLRALACCR
jgi:hypothetical protein